MHYTFGLHIIDWQLLLVAAAIVLVSLARQTWS